MRYTCFRLGKKERKGSNPAPDFRSWKKQDDSRSRKKKSFKPQCAKPMRKTEAGDSKRKKKRAGTRAAGKGEEKGEQGP